MTGTILCVVHQAGAARALAPVIEELQTRGCTTTIHASGLAAAVLAEEGLQCRVVPKLDAMLAPSLLSRSPAVVLTGTSAVPTIEHAVTKAARVRHTPVVAVLDSWTEYPRRFAGVLDPIEFLPDSLAVMDQAAALALTAIGVPKERLAVTGHPHLDRMRVISEAERLKVRSYAGAAEHEKLIVFVSEPLSQGACEEPYTELTVLQGLLANIAAHPSVPWRLAVKPHPVEDPSRLLQMLKGNAVPFEIVEGMPGWTLAGAADVTVGMKSILLVESMLCGTPTISFQPGCEGVDSFFGTRLGITPAAYDQPALEAMLLTAVGHNGRLARAIHARARLGLDGHAAQRVADLVCAHATHRRSHS